MSAPAVSEIYTAPPEYILEDVPPNGHYDTYGYRLAELKSSEGKPVPEWGNTVVFGIAPGAFTEPVYVIKPEHTATFTVQVAAGVGKLVRSFASGASEIVDLKEGDEVVVTPGQAYSYVNTGEDSLVLVDTAMKAFKEGDDVELLPLLASEHEIKERPTIRSFKIETPNGQERIIRIPTSFFEKLAETVKDNRQI